VKRRLLLPVVLLSCALAAAAILYPGLPDAAGGNGSPAAGALEPGSVLVGQDLEAQSRELDRQLQSTDAHRELLDRLSADLIARRRTLPEAAGLLADFSRQRKGEWLRDVGRRHATISPDDMRVAGAGDDGTVRVWTSQADKEDRLLRGHADKVYGVAFSPDGKLLASASEDGTVKVWDAQPPQEKLNLEGQAVDLAALSQDGNRLATTDRAADGKRLATVGMNGSVTLFDAQTGKEALALAKGWGAVAGLGGPAAEPGGAERVVAANRPRDTRSGVAGWFGRASRLLNCVDYEAVGK
jgi:hypothetical protein